MSRLFGHPFRPKWATCKIGGVTVHICPLLLDDDDHIDLFEDVSAHKDGLLCRPERECSLKPRSRYLDMFLNRQLQYNPKLCLLVRSNVWFEVFTPNKETFVIGGRHKVKISTGTESVFFDPCEHPMIDSSILCNYMFYIVGHVDKWEIVSDGGTVLALSMIPFD